MLVLGGWVFIMSEVPLYPFTPLPLHLEPETLSMSPGRGLGGRGTVPGSGCTVKGTPTGYVLHPDNASET